MTRTNLGTSIARRMSVLGALLLVGLALLTGCRSAASQAFGEVAKGTWAVTFPLDPEQQPLTVVVDEGGTLTLTRGSQAMDGTWQFNGGTLQIALNGYYEGQSALGIAAGIPTEIPTTYSGVFPWSWQARDTFQVGAEWDQATSTLVITSQEHGQTMRAEARRS